MANPSTSLRAPPHSAYRATAEDARQQHGRGDLARFIYLGFGKVAPATDRALDLGIGSVPGLVT